MTSSPRPLIPYNIPLLTGREQTYVLQTIQNRRFSGDGPVMRKCEKLLESRLGAQKVLLTPSCTHAIEMAALLLDIKPGDEVIMPSYTFVSSANAFVLRGATIVFVDVDPVTMNIDPQCVRAAVTPHTRAILVVHYAGVGCDMDALLEIVQGTEIALIEDAAQAIAASYKGRPLGSIGALGCISFHETKNLHCGEGGALVVNDRRMVSRAEILREKGTNRSNFLRGEVDKYTWVDIGSSYLPSEVSAAFLLPQLEDADAITERRTALWQRYYAGLANSGLELPRPPADCRHNGHIFWVKFADEATRDNMIAALRAEGIQAPFHYVPLHATGPGRRFGRFQGADKWTTREASRLLRLPLYDSLTEADQERVIATLLRLCGSAQQ
ncbi:MAG TPA: dTDP-4-amino-4,6-dideoxygalactose transaminase [Rhizomicrobium sp.]|nr:dTDP-4-amino-4,6-dideoxygalactose transaminase [Rhizomicrobium sp.]